MKAFIVKDNKILLLKRSKNESNTGAWSIPGGKLETPENPFEGLKREVAEETSLKINILNPLRVHYFQTEEGQTITLISFYCKYAGGEITLNEEHDEFKWVNIEDSSNEIVEHYVDDVNALKEVLSRAKPL